MVTVNKNYADIQNRCGMCGDLIVGKINDLFGIKLCSECYKGEFNNVIRKTRLKSDKKPNTVKETIELLGMHAKRKCRRIESLLLEIQERASNINNDECVNELGKINDKLTKIEKKLGKILEY